MKSRSHATGCESDHPGPHPTASIDSLLSAGIHSHRKGDLASARSCYQSVLNEDPHHFDALQLLASLSATEQDFNQALRLFDQALEISAKSASVHNNHGCCQRSAGLMTSALKSFDAAIKLQPDFANAHFNRGNALREMGYFEEAIQSYKSAIKLKADYSGAIQNLVNTYRDLGRLQEALEFFHAVLEQHPDCIHLYNSIGMVLSETGHKDAAIEVYNAGLSISPDSIDLFYNRGNAFRDIGRSEDALDSYNAAINVDPSKPELHNNRGVILQKLGRLSDAVLSYRAALAIDSACKQGFCNLGMALFQCCDFAGATSNYDRAIELDPEFAEAKWNKGLLNLLQGNFREGWQLYDWRLKMPDAEGKYSFFNKPDWRGDHDISDKRLLVPSEQGLGDLIQFCRYAPLLLEHAGEVLLEVHAALAPVIRTLHPSIRLVIKGEPLPDFDVYCPVMSLPYAFKTTLETIPLSHRYLSCDRIKASSWREYLGPKNKPRVGLVWSGSPNHDNDHNRSIELTELLPILNDSIEWHSLQKEYRDGDYELVKGTPQLHEHREELHDFSDTAALIDCLDLVVTVDTSVAHLAGALGKPVWIMLPLVPDYRWLLDRDDSPWYESARLYRQEQIRCWSTVLAQIELDLLALFE